VITGAARRLGAATAVTLAHAGCNVVIHYRASAAEAEATAAAACAAGERLISGWHAVGFYTKASPSAALTQSVSTARSIRGNSVVVRGRAGADVGAVRAVLQVGVVCGGGS